MSSLALLSCRLNADALPSVSAAVAAVVVVASLATAAAGATAPPAAISPAAVGDLLVSVSTDTDLGGLPVRDQDLVVHAEGGAARVAWPSETLALLSGDLSGNGLAEVFGDVDAVHDHGAGETARDGLYLSLLSNEDGFLDGDVLRATATGFVTFLAEDHFATIIGSIDGAIDVDAFHLDDDGTVLFSLGEDEDSSALSGDAAGVVRDGAILSWSPGDPLATILFAESQVGSMVSAALGSATSIGDVKGLARDPDGGAVLFTVQSPSAHDASVFTTAGGGSVLAGHSEADFGFGTNAELDGLSVSRSSFPAVTVSSARPQAGETLTVRLAGAQPGSAWIVLASLGSDASPSLPLGGWGGLVLTHDALLAIMLAAAGNLVVVPDAFGEAVFVDDLGPSLPALDVVIQIVSPAPVLQASNPVLVELAQ